MKLGLQATRSDTLETFVPAGKVSRREPPYDFGEEFLTLAAWRATREEFLDVHIDVWYSSDGEKELSVRKDLVRFFGY